MRESDPFGRSAVPSDGQKRTDVSNSVPHCGHTLRTGTVMALSVVAWRASRPEPRLLAASASSSAWRISRSATGSVDAAGAGESGGTGIAGADVCAAGGFLEREDFTRASGMAAAIAVEQVRPPCDCEGALAESRAPDRTHAQPGP